MNIFVLDENTNLAAQYHCNKHCVKQILETAQLLCNSHHLCGNKNAPYKLTHKNHPCSVWARKTVNNYIWLVNFGTSLCKEYTYRYERIHKCQAIIEWCKQNIPDLPDGKITRFAEAMPNQYKSTNPVNSYRYYYANEKRHLFQWKKRKEPWWIKEYSFSL